MDEKIFRESSLTGILKKDIKHYLDIFKNDETFEFRLIDNQDCSIRCGIVYLSPLIDKNIINNNLISPIMKSDIENNIKKEDIIDFIKYRIINILTVKKTSDEQTIILNILQGNTVIFLNGILEALVVDTKGGQVRDIKEPEGESVIRGSREGFNESLKTNISLIRRKIISSQLKFSYREVGNVTRTKICICYLDNVVSKQILEELNKRLSTIKIDGVLESGYIEELIRDHSKLPFNTVGNTEKPDVVASKLLEGRIAILCDGTPFVLTIPFLFLENIQNVEDYNNNYIYGSFNRLIRILGFFLATSIPAIYLAVLTYHQEMVPTQLLLSIAASRESVPLPIFIEAIIMLLIFDILKEASTRMPKTLGQTVSIIGALVLGEAAVQAKIISPSMVIIVATTGICSYLLPKIYMPILILRYIFMIASSAIGLYGYLFAAICISFYLTSMKSFGVNYMSKFIKIDKESLYDTSIRYPWWYTQKKDKFNINNLLNK